MHRIDNTPTNVDGGFVAQIIAASRIDHAIRRGAVVANVSVFSGGRHAQLDCDACFGGRFRIVEVYVSAGTRGQLILSNRFQRTKASEGGID